MRSMLILTLAAASLPAANPNFSVPRSYSAAGYVLAVAKGDFNGDGKPDIAVAGYSASTTTVSDVHILLSNGDGTFNSLPSIAPGSGPVALAVADFNGDHKLDLAVVNSFSHTVSVMLGNGDGTFGAPISFAVSAPTAIAAGDINGDGKVDLVVGDGSGYVIFIGKGNGTFRQSTSVSLGYTVNQVTLTDLNHDGKLDLSYCSTGPGAGVMTQLGNGNGTFAASTNFTAAADTFLFADFNGDGIPDIAVGYGSVQIGLGNGDGTFTAGASITLPYVPFAGLAAGDFNEDGHMDLVVGGQADSIPGNLAVLLGKGDGTFAVPAMLAEECPCAIVTGDWNGDHHLDLALGNNRAFSASIALGNGHGGFSAALTPNAGPIPVNMAAADLNMDGKADLVVVNARTSMHRVGVDLLYSNGNGTFQPPVKVAVGTTPVAVAVADLNHDGILDLVVADISRSIEGVWVLLGKPGGTYQSPVGYALLSIAQAVAIGDLNGDGIPDIMVAGGFQNHVMANVTVMLGKGDGTFGAAQNYPAGFSLTAIVTADFNGDGKLDVAVTDSSNGVVEIFLGNGDGTLGPPVTVASCPQAATLVTGDFNGDGHVDLAAACSMQGVVVALGNGNGTFQPPVTYATGYALGLAAADVNRDGHTDLIATDGFTFGFTVLSGIGDGTFQNAGLWDAILGVQHILSADFNGDGKPDLAIIGGLNSSPPTPLALAIALNTTP